ncbi:MAG: LysR family transcriptional regulator [Spirochaetia bacterium]|nr:LysR family transcriptional regulator [Spirochaetia bacterium]
MELYKIKSFTKVSKLLSVSRAAEELYLTQPAVSAHIKDLEYEYGIKLFDRVGRNIQLTVAGRALLPYAYSLLETFEDSHLALNMLKDKEHGTIQLGVSKFPGSRIVPQCLSAFLKKHPSITISIECTNSHDTISMVKKQKLDLGIIGSSEKAVSDDCLESRLLFTDEVVIAVGKDHPFAGRSHIAVEELADQPVIAALRNTVTRNAVDTFFHKFSIPYRLAYEVDNKSMIKNMVSNNLGISFFSSLEIQKDVELGLLKKLKVEGVTVYRYILLIYNKNKKFSPSLELYFNHMCSCSFPSMLTLSDHSSADQQYV